MRKLLILLLLFLFNKIYAQKGDIVFLNSEFPVVEESTITLPTPICFYDFDETSGNLLDKTANSLDGTVGTATQHYDSQDQYLFTTTAPTITVTDNDLLTMTGTHAIWVVVKTPTTYNANICFKRREFQFQWISGNKLQFFSYYNGTDNSGWYNSEAYSTNKTYRVLINCPGNGNAMSTNKMYVDNVLDSPTSTGGYGISVSNTAYDFFIGCSTNAGSGWNSTIIQYAIFSDTLDVDQRATLYNGGIVNDFENLTFE